MVPCELSVPNFSCPYFSSYILVISEGLAMGSVFNRRKSGGSWSHCQTLSHRIKSWRFPSKSKISVWCHFFPKNDDLNQKAQLDPNGIDGKRKSDCCILSEKQSRRKSTQKIRIAILSIVTKKTVFSSAKLTFFFPKNVIEY